MPGAHAPEDLNGRRLGEFVVKDKLGEGGFGEVYRAEQPILGREAVIKVLHDRHQGSPIVTQRFLREARLGSRLDHPYAAHIYGFGAEPDGLLWIAMELVRGTPLSEILAERKRIPLDQLVPLIDRLCEVVHSAHEQGIVHRDLKPANVMVIARAGRWLPKLLDLGIAKGVVDDEAAPRAPGPITAETPIEGGGAVTRRGDLVGSPRYMAPEQWVQGTVDARTDVYALAILAYECANGRSPFPGDTLGALARAHATGEIPAVEADLPGALDEVFRRALAKRPEDRHPTALELATAFRSAAGLAPEGEPLPRLDEELRELWLAEAPQPIAEAIAVLDAARHLHQAQDAAVEVVRALVRWLGILAIMAHSRVAEGATPLHELAENLAQILRRRHVDADAWRQLVRELLARWQRRPDAHPLPELARGAPRVDALLEPLLARTSQVSPAADRDLRAQLGQTLVELRALLGALAFLLEYPMVVADGETPVTWIGVRRTHRRALASAGAPLTPGRAFLADARARPVLSLWPLVQIHAPAPGAAAEAFLLDGRGPRGARLVAFPRGFERQDEDVWDWFGREVLATDTEGQVEAEPYRGLAPFTSADSSRFIGRERQAEAFVNRLLEVPLLAVVGPSGAGKSSFVHAGVLPLVPPSWKALSMRPGASPLAALVAVLDRAGAPPAGGLAERLRALAWAEKQTVVLVVDQLEELFSLCRDDAERTAFAAVLSEAGDPLRIVLTLRDDFLARAAELPRFGERLRQGLELLTTPGPDQLQRIVTVPAQRAGYDFDDPSLPAEMVAEVDGRPGALPLLSFTASRLWADRDRHFKRLTRRAYQALGGVAGALAQHAEANLAAMTLEEQRLVRVAFRHLVTAEATRAVLTRLELSQVLGQGPVADAVIAKLIDARLLVAHDEGKIEIIHETLLAAWPRLVGWQREDAEGARLRDQLRAAARQWDERGRPGGLLWRDEALAEYLRWRARFPGGMSEVEEAFGAASRVEADRARRTRRLVIGGVIGGLAVALGVTLLFARTAAREGERAEVQRARAEQTLTAQYEEQGRQLLVAGDTPRALPYLLEALDRGADSPGLRRLLGRAERMTRRQQLLLAHPAPVFRAIYTAGGARVVTAADDGQVRIWSTRTGLVERTLDAGGRARAIALSPDGDQLLTATETGHARVFAMADGTLLESRPGAGQGHPVLAWSPDGRRYLVVSFGEAARVFTRGAPDPIVLEGQDRALAVSALDDGRLWLASRRAPALLFSPEGRRIGALGESTDTTAVASGPGSHALAFGGLDGTVRIVEIPAPGGAAKPGRVIGRLTGGVQALAFSPDGTRLMAGGRDGGIALLRATGGDDVPLLGHTGWILKGEFDRAGEHVVSASGDASARVWNVPRGRLETVLAGHTARVIDVSFSPDGKQIVTASLDGTVRLWLARDPELLAAFSPPPSQPAILHFAETGELFVVSQEGITSAWRVAGGTPTAVLTTGPRALRDVVPLPDGFLVLSPDGSRRVTPAGEHPVEIALEQAVGAALLEAEGPLALVSEAEIVLVAPESGQVIGRWRTGASQPTSVCAIPGGRLAVATQGGHVIVWDVSARRALHQLDHPPLIMFQAATRRGELLTAGEDGTVRIWRKDGTLGGTLEGHTDAVRAVAVSADGEIVATGGSDGSVRVWELERRRLLATFRPSGREIITLAFDAKRDRVAAGDGTGEVFVWDVRDYRGTAEELGASIGCLVPFAFRDGGLVAREITTCGATR